MSKKGKFNKSLLAIVEEYETSTSSSSSKSSDSSEEEIIQGAQKGMENFTLPCAMCNHYEFLNLNLI